MCQCLYFLGVTQRKRLTTANITPGLTNGAHPGIHVSLSVPISQKVALDPEGEESEEDGEIGGGNWNWREDDRYMERGVGWGWSQWLL